MAVGDNYSRIKGNLGKDPEVRFTPSGTMTATVNVATNEKWIDRSSGEEKTRTEWHRCVFFGRLAEEAQKLKKGGRVLIEGHLHTRYWKDQNNVERSISEIVVKELSIPQWTPRPKTENDVPSHDIPSPPPAIDEEIPF